MRRSGYLSGVLCSHASLHSFTTPGCGRFLTPRPLPGPVLMEPTQWSLVSPAIRCSPQVTSSHQGWGFSEVFEDMMFLATTLSLMEIPVFQLCSSRYFLFFFLPIYLLPFIPESSTIQQNWLSGSRRHTGCVLFWIGWKILYEVWIWLQFIIKCLFNFIT